MSRSCWTRGINILSVWKSFYQDGCNGDWANRDENSDGAGGDARQSQSSHCFGKIHSSESFLLMLVKVMIVASTGSAGDSTSDVVPNVEPDERQPRRFRAE